MLIAASSDIHSPKYIRLFIDSIRNLPVPDLFLLAGDLVLRGAAGAFDLIHEEVRQNWEDVPVSPYWQRRIENTKRKLKREYSDIIWLDDEQVQVKGVDIFGTTEYLMSHGLAKQSRTGYYQDLRNRMEKIETFASKHPNSILLTHYAVGTYTIDPVPNPLQLTSEKLLQSLLDLPITVIHGHCHYAPNGCTKRRT